MNAKINKKISYDLYNLSENELKVLYALLISSINTSDIRNIIKNSAVCYDTNIDKDTISRIRYELTTMVNKVLR